MAVTAGAVLVGRRCNPYGAETGGPRHVLGGLYGPASARTPGMHLPEHIEQGEWKCEQAAQVRCRMVCRCGHKGQVMELCSYHDEDNFRAEYAAGSFRRVRETVRVRGHFEEIQRRQSDLCPRCAFPPPYGELMKEIQAWQRELYPYQHSPRAWHSPEADALRTKIDDAGKMMDLAIAQGIIHNCPLTLIPVS